MTKRVLVVDDETAIQTIVKVSLELTAGWIVLTASSASAGLEIAKAEQPDLILLDVTMPETDGIALFHQLQAQPLTRDIPVIFLTAQTREAERKSLQQMSSGTLAKPFDPEAIAQQIKTLLNWH